MSRRPSRESLPLQKPGACQSINHRFSCVASLAGHGYGAVVKDLSGHTDCCGSECRLFHLGSIVYNSLYRALAACKLQFLLWSLYIFVFSETTIAKCVV